MTTSSSIVGHCAHKFLHTYNLVHINPAYVQLTATLYRSLVTFSHFAGQTLYEMHAWDASLEDGTFTEYLLLKRMSPGLYIVRAKTDCMKEPDLSPILMCI